MRPDHDAVPAGQNLAARLSPSGRAARMRLLDWTIREGRPYDPRLPMDPEIDARLGELLEKRVVTAGDDGQIRCLYPVSALPTPHRVALADGRSFSAMCALDSLGAAFTFGQDARIRSSCSLCGAPVAAEVRGGELAGFSPGGLTVLHMDLDETANWATSC